MKYKYILCARYKCDAKWYPVHGFQTLGEAWAIRREYEMDWQGCEFDYAVVTESRMMELDLARKVSE